PGREVGTAKSSFLLRAILRGTGALAAWRECLVRMVQLDAGRPAQSSDGGWLLAGQRCVQGVWHGHGAHRSADPERFSAYISTLSARDCPLLRICNRSPPLRRRDLIGASLPWMLAIASSPWTFGRPPDTTSQAEPVFNALLLDGRKESGR